jgi:hypothetical protein
MNEDRALALARRQGRLLERSAALRAQVVRHSRPLQRTLAEVDEARAQAQAGWQWLQAHPQVPLAVAGAVAGLLLVRRPRRTLGRAWRFAWRWGRRSVFAWQLWRRWGGLRPVVAGAAADASSEPAGAAAAAPLPPWVRWLVQVVWRWGRRATTRR